MISKLPPCLEDAIILAVEAHRGQLDRCDQPFIFHPLRVMLKMPNEAARLVGILHDVIEDTTVALEDLRRAGFSDEICGAVDCLTRRKREPYDHYIERVATSPLAKIVKLADLEDNLDPGRRSETDLNDMRRRERYIKARARLLSDAVAGGEEQPRV